MTNLTVIARLHNINFHYIISISNRHIENAFFFLCVGQEKWEDFGAYLKALEEGDCIPMQYLKCYLVGIPGVGKTTTMKRLVKMPTDDSFCESTTVNCIPMKATEKWKATVKCHRQIQDRCGVKVEQNYIKFGDAECDMSLASNEFEDVIELYHCTERSKKSMETQEMKHPRTNITANVDDGHSSETTALTSHSPTENDAIPSTASSQEHPVLLEDGKVPEDIKETVRYFQKQLEENGGNFSASEGVKLILMIDIGGQSAFLEMLPLLMKGPSLYMTFFKLSNSEDPFEEQYSDEFRVNQSTAYHKDNTSVCTVGEVIIQILSSVALSRYPSNEVKNLMKKLVKHSHGMPASFSPSKICTIPDSEQVYHEHQAKAFLIGTFKDILKGSLHNNEKLLEDKLEAIDEKIQDKIGEVFGSSMKRKLIAYRNLGRPPKDGKPSVPTRLTFSLDKFSGDEEIKELRGRLMEEIKEIKNFKVPVQWLIFGLILRKEYEWITVKDCEYLAKELHIKKDDVKEVLIFLSSITGMLLYQPEIDDPCLQKVVICNIQSIFTSISEQILDSAYCDEERTPYNEYVGELELGKFCCKRAEHGEKCILEESMRHQDQKLQTIPRSSLLSLLSHHHIIACTSFESDATNEYIMPAALDFCYKPKDVIESLKEDYSPDITLPCPLFIKFNIGYSPPGLFSCLITTLYNCKKIKKDVQCLVKRNFICFEEGGAMIALVACSRWYEVHVINYDPERADLEQVCVLVKDAVLRHIGEVLEHLRFCEKSTRSHLKLHIQCSCKPNRPDHFVELNNLVNKEGRFYVRCESCRRNIFDCCWIPPNVSPQRSRFKINLKVIREIIIQIHENYDSCVSE